MSKKCLWPWGHQFTKWEVTANLQKINRNNEPVKHGFQQQRTCEKCGRLELREVWGTI